LTLFLFAVHLILAKEKDGAIRKSGILAQIFMAGSFTLEGINHWMYGNNGVNDGKGMAAFWLIWLVSSVFFTCSGLSHAYFAKESTEKLSNLRFCCADRFLGLYQAFMVLSCTGNVVGCLWCVLSPELHVEDIIDNFDDEDGTDLPICIRIVSFSHVLLYFSYALLWIPTGLLLKAAARQNPTKILGLTTPIAAGSTVLFQWTVGAMYFVYLVFASWIRGGDDYYDEFLELYEKTYGAQVIHYGMLMTFYCAHNVSWTLTIPSKTRAATVTTKRVVSNKKKVVPTAKSPLASEIEDAEQGILMKKKTTTIRFVEPQK
jgi:hypothetical protein